MLRLSQSFGKAMQMLNTSLGHIGLMYFQVQKAMISYMDLKARTPFSEVMEQTEFSVILVMILFIHKVKPRQDLMEMETLYQAVQATIRSMAIMLDLS